VTLFVEQMENGLTVVGEPQPGARSVSFSLQLPLGAARDPDDKLGLSHLTQELLFKGAGPWDGRALAAEIDQIGFQETHRTEREMVAYSGTVLPQHLERALDLIRTVFREPHLPDAGLEEVRQFALHQLRALEDAPASKMFYELGQRFFPKPLSNPSDGTLETLASVTLDDARAFWRRYSPRGSALAVAGALTREGMLGAVREAFGDWAGEEPADLPLEPPARRMEHLHKETEQMQIGIAYDSVPFTHPDYLKARVGVNALSGGMSARLFVEVRQKRGLAYTVFAAHVTTREQGGVLGYAGTTPERAQETLDVVLAELDRLRAGITPEEFAKAKTRLKTDVIVQDESTRGRAEALAREHLYAGRLRELDEILGEIDALTLEGVNAYLAGAGPRDLMVLTLGPKALTLPANAQAHHSKGE